MNLCNNWTLQNCLKHCISATCRAKKCATPDMPFELLDYCTLMSRKYVPGWNDSGGTGEDVADVQRQSLKRIMGKPDLCTCHAVENLWQWNDFEWTTMILCKWNHYGLWQQSFAMIIKILNKTKTIQRTTPSNDYNCSETIWLYDYFIRFLVTVQLALDVMRLAHLRISRLCDWCVGMFWA